MPAGALAQVWRGGSRQARLAQFLAEPEVAVAVLDEPTAGAVGVLCGRSGHADVVDVHVALHALENKHHIVTSDPDNLRAISGTVPLIII